MATKKPLSKKTHFHIPADPLRIQSEDIKARHISRKENGLQHIKDTGATNITNEMLFEMLNDVLERQEILDCRLQKIMKANHIR